MNALDVFLNTLPADMRAALSEQDIEEIAWELDHKDDLVELATIARDLDPRMLATRLARDLDPRMLATRLAILVLHAYDNDMRKAREALCAIVVAGNKIVKLL